MKKALKIIGILLWCAIMIYGIYLSCQDNFMDFGGTITQISESDGYTILTVDAGYNIIEDDEVFPFTYTVIADGRTNVRNYHKEDGDITLSELKIGDKIQGDYKKLSSRDHYAKLIEVI